MPTPSYIADQIIERTLWPAISGKSPTALAGFTVADICCGSGIFLLSAYEYLLGHYLSWYVGDDPAKYAGRQIYEAGAGLWRLTFEEKRRILLAHLRGVDIDANAVEVAQFSLLLKLVEDESEAALKDYVGANRQPALPDLADTIRWGNSLVSTSEWQAVRGAMPTSLRDKVNPFTWADEFPTDMCGGGFNVIVGNPPYIRIQNMVTYSREEVAFYQNDKSPYTTAKQDNFDKYALFIERSLSLVRPDGRIGVIVPHKFMSIQAGRALRKLLAGNRVLEEIVHFGIKQVFGRGTSNYTCILVMNRAGSQNVKIERAGPLEAWRYGQEGVVTLIPAEELGDDPWQFANEEARELFARIRDQVPARLAEVADIEVGVQTSADGVYIIRQTASDVSTVTCQWDGRDWRIEREILRPCLHDVPLFPYIHPSANAWMIFPYKLVENGNLRARLIQPDEMAANYPGCWEYLSARRAELEKRNIVGGAADERQWYQYGRSQSLMKFSTPKIILPVLSVEARYAYDEVNTMFTGGGNGPYYMVRAKEDAAVSTLYLLAILNHPLSEAFVRTNTSSFRGGYYSHGKQFIENLPVPIPEATQMAGIEAKVKELITANEAYTTVRTRRAQIRKERDIRDLRLEVEQLISAEFGLSDADLRIIEAVPIPS